MNGVDYGCCHTNGADDAKYPIPTDSNGHSVLTGEGADEKSDFKKFTLVELEVFLVK